MAPTKTKSLFTNIENELDTIAPIVDENFSKQDRKLLIDSLVDPLFVISNANSMLKTKLEKFVDDDTRQNFYMIDRAQEKLVTSINQLRYGKNTKT